MLNQTAKGTPVHFPNRNDVFEFDEEVAAIFENMATRSIPLYMEAHRVHAMIAQTYLRQQINVENRRNIQILDIGASVGGFVKALCNRLQCNPDIGPASVVYHATDPSVAMVEEFKRAHPWATCCCCDACTPTGTTGGFDIALLMYVMQFVPVGERDDVLNEVYKSMRPGGIIFLGQKEKVEESIMPIYSAEYIRWRMDNGYSQQEIAAKTRALEGVMWPEPLDVTLARLERIGFSHARETTRWLQFSTVMARR
jgi:tRNA (cmo5U34)-methyltransferase